MNLLQKTERLLKQNWKERKRITLAVIVSFLINGSVGYATENESKSNIDIQAKEGSSITVTKDKDSGGTIVNIAKPNKEGISHNEYDVFNMTGENSRVLFNNSGIDDTAGRSGESALGFKNVKKIKIFLILIRPV